MRRFTRRRCLYGRCVGLDPFSDVGRGVAVESPIKIFGSVADVRRREDVLQLPEGMVGRQWLGFEYVDRGPGYPARLQRLDQSHLVDDRTTRCVDESRRRLHQGELGRSDHPLVRLLKTRWTVTTSASGNSVCLSTRVAPAALAFSSVRFWLQAITFMPKARPMRATSLPMFPSPTTPRLLPLRFEPRLVCHPPALSEAASRSMPRMLARISDQVNSMVGVES